MKNKPSIRSEYSTLVTKYFDHFYYTDYYVCSRNPRIMFLHGWRDLRQGFDETYIVVSKHWSYF